VDSALGRADQLPEVAGGILGERVPVAVEGDHPWRLAARFESGEDRVELCAETNGRVRPARRPVLGVHGEVHLVTVVGLEPARVPELGNIGAGLGGAVPEQVDQPRRFRVGTALGYAQVHVVHGGHAGIVGRASRVLCVPEPAVPVTGDAAADAFLVENPFALLLGMLLDQQVPMEWAFKGPYTLNERLGGSLDPRTLAAMSPDDVEAVFKAKPALHRFPGSMGKRAYALAQAIVDDYGGDTTKVWREAKSGQALYERLRALPGFGEEKSKIFVALLAKRLGVKPTGWEAAAAPFSDATPRSVADIDSQETLAQVRDWKRAQKKKGKTKAD